MPGAASGAGDRLSRVLIVMRVQGWTGVAMLPFSVAALFWSVRYAEGDQSLAGMWLAFGAWFAGLGAALLMCARHVGRGSAAARVYTFAVEVVLLVTGWWFWPLLPVTVLAPPYVVAMLLRTPLHPGHPLADGPTTL